MNLLDGSLPKCLQWLVQEPGAESEVSVSHKGDKESVIWTTTAAPKGLCE